MRKKWLPLLGSVMAAALCVSPAFGGSPLGPPTAGLDRGRLRAAGEYSYGETDLEWDEKLEVLHGDVEDLATSVVLGRLAYGVTQHWEAYLRLGAADAQFDMKDYSLALPEAANNEQLHLPDASFDGGYELVWGFGGKYTFWQPREDLDWGVMFQMAWFDWDDRVAGAASQKLSGAGQEFTVAGDYAMGIDLEYYELEVALGPTWQATDRLCVYGGPFLHWIRGEMDVDLEGSFAVRDSEGLLVDEALVSVPESGDVEQESEFGGFVGGQFDLAEAVGAFLEVRCTTDSWAVSGGGGWRF